MRNPGCTQDRNQVIEKMPSKETHVFDEIGDMAASAVTPDHVLSICRKIERAGHGVQSERTKSTIGGCYRYGVKERYPAT